MCDDLNWWISLFVIKQTYIGINIFSTKILATHTYSITIDISIHLAVM